METVLPPSLHPPGAQALIPARRWHDLLAEEGEDVYDACMYEEGEAEVEESVVPQ